VSRTVRTRACASAADQVAYAFCNTSLGVDDRVDALVQLLTVRPSIGALALSVLLCTVSVACRSTKSSRCSRRGSRRLAPSRDSASPSMISDPGRSDCLRPSARQARPMEWSRRRHKRRPLGPLVGTIGARTAFTACSRAAAPSARRASPTPTRRSVCRRSDATRTLRALQCCDGDGFAHHSRVV
jgi:hypothetical protein